MGKALLLLAALLVAAPALAQDAPSPAEEVRGEVAALVSLIDLAPPSEVAFVATSSSVNIIPGRAWILSVWTGAAPAYGAEYFVLSEIDGRLTGELLERPGPQGTRTLTGEALARFLERVELDPGPLRAAVERHHERR